MKKLMLAIALVPFLVSAAVCRYCSGTKVRTVETICEKCSGTGIFQKDMFSDKVACPYCDKVKGLGRSRTRGEIVPSSGRIRKRVACDKCAILGKSRAKEIFITPSQLDTLVDEGSISLGGVKIVVRGENKNGVRGEAPKNF